MSNAFARCPACDAPNPRMADGNPPFHCFACGHQFRKQTRYDIHMEAYRLLIEADRNPSGIRTGDLFRLIDKAYELGKRHGRDDALDRDYEALLASA